MSKAVQLVFLGALFFLYSCQKNSSPPSDNPEYWSLESKVQKALANLDGLKPRLERTMVLNNKTVLDTLESPDWSKELALFDQLHISPVDWKSAYEVKVESLDTKHTKSVRKWTFRAMDENMELRDMTVWMDEKGDLLEVQAFIHQHNIFRKNGKRLKYIGEEGYSIELRDTVVFKDVRITKVHGKFLEPSPNP